MDNKEVISWLGNMRRLETEIKMLEDERESLLIEHRLNAELEVRDVPNTNIVGGKSDTISNPTEEKAIRSLCKGYVTQMNRNTKKIEKAKSDIKYIKDRVKEEMKKGAITDIEYKVLYSFHFKYMSHKQIAKDNNIEVQTSKDYKCSAVTKLGKVLEYSLLSA